MYTCKNAIMNPIIWHPNTKYIYVCILYIYIIYEYYIYIIYITYICMYIIIYNDNMYIFRQSSISWHMELRRRAKS